MLDKVSHCHLGLSLSAKTSLITFSYLSVLFAYSRGYTQHPGQQPCIGNRKKRNGVYVQRLLYYFTDLIHTNFFKYPGYILLSYLFIYLFTLQILFPLLWGPLSDWPTSHTSSQPCLYEDVSTLHFQPHLPSKLPGASKGLGTSSLIELRPQSPLLYISWGPHIRWCMLPGCWSSVWEILWVQVNWDCWSSYRFAILLSFFPPFPNSTPGLSSFCPLAGCKHLHLTLSDACWVFQSAVMLGPFLWALHIFSNSVRPWDLRLSRIPLWACHWTFLSSVSSSYPSLQFFQIGTIMDQSFDCGMSTPFLIWCPIFLLEVDSLRSLSLLLSNSSKVPPPYESARFSPPSSLVHSGGCPNLLPPEAICFHSFCCTFIIHEFILEYMIFHSCIYFNLAYL